MTARASGDSAQVFAQLKASCVPLLGNSLLTPSSVPTVSRLLLQVITTLREATAAQITLKPSLISYVFIPISTILQRNSSTALPDQILERLLVVLSILCEAWWWDMDERTWEQIFNFSSFVIGGLEGKGKSKERDDETRLAAVQCIWALLHERSSEENPNPAGQRATRAEEIFSRFCSHTQSDKFIPIIGQTVHSLLSTAGSSHRPLQVVSLQVLRVITKHYLMDGFAPSILPGLVSSMCKIALGIGNPRGWANGDVVSAALSIMGETIVLSIADDVCTRDGVVKRVDDLESLTQLFTESTSEPSFEKPTSQYHVRRTQSWLKATVSQLHMAIISLQPLVAHQTPSAQIALASFSSRILQSTTLTFPQSQPLLLSYLLSLSTADFPDVSVHAMRCMQDVLTGTRRHELLSVLLLIAKDCMISLPRHLSARAEAKLIRASGIIDAICNLSSAQSPAATAIQGGVETLLGPNGGIEKWGWNLLSTLEFTTTPVILSSASASQLLLSSNSEVSSITPFPEIILRNVSARASMSLESMFRSLGRAAGEGCIYAIEWFLRVGRNGCGTVNVAALCCAARLLEGTARVSLPMEAAAVPPEASMRSKRLDKLARNIAKSLAENWEGSLGEPTAAPQEKTTEELEVAHVQHVVGLLPVRGSLDSNASLPSAERKPAAPQNMLHRMVMLQLLAITAGILEVRFVSTLLDTLFPILHSMISDYSPLATAALATLQYVANATSYASAANMLLSNFDYALDAVSRRLSRRWLDLDATSVLVILVRLVGRDVVQRASDVVEECFDRLDEYHGYEVLVNGLMSVLAEVVETIAADSDEQLNREIPLQEAPPEPMQTFLHWYAHRNDEQVSQPEHEDDANVGPVPQEAWSSLQTEDEQKDRAADPLEEPPSTPSQLLVQQIMSRSLYFLTHDSRAIRARTLTLLASSATVLPASLILPSIHYAWPFVLNRLADPEPFVVTAAASLIEALVANHGDFMYGRIWDDIWPRFREILRKLESADSESALARRGLGAVGTESAYTHSHRLYRSLLRTMTVAARGVQVKDSAVWDVIVAHRRFLHSGAHEELQHCARELYVAIGRKNEDAVWFALTGTIGVVGTWGHLYERKWDVRLNTELVLQRLRQ